ncbi:odorant-binding protein-like [Halichoerus grypus]|uniref:odorant-binding protein-like n=1 Tax=Halichoerus grypus TaxID=9711 RepID=UPI0016597E3D|nr:odorant-binding protein-like [Halichoerus grypus]
MIYLAASNFDKINENSPFRGYLRHVNVDIARRKILFNFFIKVDGQCTEKSVIGTAGQNNAISVDYEGNNDFQIVDITPNTMLGYDVNVDEEGNITEIVLLTGRGHHVDEETIEKFKELTRQKNIPEENIVKVIDTDNCPINE